MYECVFFLIPQNIIIIFFLFRDCYLIYLKNGCPMKINNHTESSTLKECRGKKRAAGVDLLEKSSSATCSRQKGHCMKQRINGIIRQCPFSKIEVERRDEFVCFMGLRKKIRRARGNSLKRNLRPAPVAEPQLLSNSQQTNTFKRMSSPLAKCFFSMAHWLYV